MLELLWLVPAIPFASAALLLLFGARLSPRGVGAIGVGSLAVAAVLSLAMAMGFQGAPYRQVLWTWMDVAGFRPEIAFYLDALSLTMMAVVACVGFLIHLYSAEFMAGDEGYSRFFGYMNLFVASMVTLLLADNLLLLYLGWEGVGLCSYLLIGFWYRDPANGRAARKAFIVTRVGDTAMLLALFLIFHSLGTLRIQDLMERAAAQWPAGSTLPLAAAALLLGGAVGKSAQLPLQTWLPDAMAGPTPTSALIHAATMVTAGVYLIARTHVLFTLAPPVQAAVAVVGTATLLMAGFSALVQSDIKRVLAYSTISQIGYMFLALGVAAWQAAIFHFMTHAFFKALLFLAAGAVIEALHHEHNIFRMGGLRSELPITFWAFLAGAGALAGLPLVTSGFFSKDWILWGALISGGGGLALWLGGLAGALLTALYTFRLIFLVFWGELKTPVTRRPGLAMTIPLVVLAALSIAAGYARAPFAELLGSALPPLEEAHVGGLSETVAGIAAGVAFLAGLSLAYLFFMRKPGWAAALASSAPGHALHRLWRAQWGLDWLYDLFVFPVVWLANANRRDNVDRIYDGLAWSGLVAHRGLSRTQTGLLRWYAAGIAAGSLALVALVLFL